MALAKYVNELLLKCISVLVHIHTQTKNTPIGINWSQWVDVEIFTSRSLPAMYNSLENSIDISMMSEFGAESQMSQRWAHFDYVKLSHNAFGRRIFRQAGWVPWLLMSWLYELPGHQQPWYWLCEVGRFSSLLRVDFCIRSLRPCDIHPTASLLTVLFSLTSCVWVTAYGNLDLGQHWLR